jgi:MFS family permease
MVIGSAWGGKKADKIKPDRMVWLGFGVMAAAAVLNVGYTALFVPDIPWAVLPLMIYTFGLAVAMPAIQVGALALFPDNRGLASSMLSFIQMMAFALVSGLLAPVLFDSAFKLACGVMAGLVLSFACWRLSRRVQAPHDQSGASKIEETLIFCDYGVDIIKRGEKFFIRYDSGGIVVKMQEDEITEEEALAAQESEQSAYQVLLACDRRASE